MSSELDQFAERLIAELDIERARSRSGYLHFSHLTESIRRAKNRPGIPSQEYPRAMYLHGDREQYITVADAEKEAEAAAQGYRRSANAPDSRYPKYFVETAVAGRGTDIRRVTLHDENEERVFFSVVESAQWDADPLHLYGGRGIGLNDLVAEHKEKLKQMIDQKQESFYGR